MADAVNLRPDPAPALVASFSGAALRMDGLDFVNPRLRVEAVRFAPQLRVYVHHLHIPTVGLPIWHLCSGSYSFRGRLRHLLVP